MLKVNEKGFTLVEILVALTIATAIMGVMAAAVITIVKTTAQNDEWNVNMRQVQNAGYRITRDALQAQSVSTSMTGVFLNLYWSDWGGNSDNVSYYFVGNTLWRNLNNSPKPTLIAQYIVLPPATTCSWNSDNQSLTVTIRASLHGTRFIQQTYQISPRPGIRGG